MEELICNLKKILSDRGIKQRWLHERVEISSSAMSQIVRGESEPTLRTALKIAEALNVTVQDIWSFKK
ncbi:helix-turn-helix transcriptional regulator [Paenibacillus humicus]|uniref:helix-turn-helix transcriptional regulator n=1 Tax=Paenibacillus humicus TaxID=412861 RepID=UPI003F1655B0